MTCFHFKSLANDCVEKLAFSRTTEKGWNSPCAVGPGYRPSHWPAVKNESNSVRGYEFEVIDEPRNGGQFFGITEDEKPPTSC